MEPVSPANLSKEGEKLLNLNSGSLSCRVNTSVFSEAIAEINEISGLGFIDCNEIRLLVQIRIAVIKSLNPVTGFSNEDSQGGELRLTVVSLSVR